MKRFMIALVAGLSGVLAADACTVIVVGKNVSATGRVIVGHNEDDSPPAWTAHSVVPARDWPAGSVVPAEEGRCAKVPQAAHTLATYWAEIKFPWGDGNADAFCNERGVLVVSDSGGQSRERDDDLDALTEGGVGHLVRRCVGERATSARDAVRIIGELVEKYGYSPSARIYTVADKDEAWLVQVVHGRNFCARRCSDDEVTILPNCYSIRRLDAVDAKDLVCSKDLQENARRKGFWDGVSPFDFAAAYQGCFNGRAEWNGLNDSNIGRYRQMIVHFTGEDWPQGKPFPFGVKPAKAKVGAADLKAVLSGHKSPYGNGVKHAEKSWAVCRSWTVESMVCEFAASPADTVLNVAEGPGCEHKYRRFRPFRGEIPADMDRDRPDPVARLATHVRPTVYGDDASAEVRPGGGERPYWNGCSIMFLYPPKFGFKPVKDAVRYRYEILDDIQDKVSFEAATPDAALTPVWPKLRVGYATLTVTGLDARGKPVGIAGTRKFWRKAPFREGAYPKAKFGYGECALKILDYQFARFAKPKPAGVNYPTKQYAMAARGMAHYAGLVKDDAKRAEAIRAAKMYADAMIALAEPEGAPLAHFPPTYFKTSKSAGQDGATTMLIYPADAALAYLDVYGVTKEAKYLQEAEAVAATYMRLQGEDGSWPLKVTIADAKPLKGNRTLTTRHVALFEKLFRLTGKDAYRAAGDRAFGYIERGPLTTWQWEGQFEDTPPSANYTNLTKHDACSTAIYIVDRYPGDKARLAQARELLRFAEDQFVNWEKPYFPGRAPKSASGFGHFWSHDHWVTPCVFEQYGCYTPVDASAAKLILTYLALYRAEGDATDLAKARALGDTMTRMTDDDGLESTWWSTDQLRQDVWPNCMFASAFALEELAETVGAALVETDQDQPAQWDLASLGKAPQVHASGYPETNGVKSVFFDGEPYKGKPTRVFAYLAVPKVVSGAKVPGIVLVHGGLGSAFRRWAKYWCEQGYAAISMDTCGCVSGNEFGDEQGAHRRHEWAGPAGWGKYEQVDKPVREQWMYHAVAAAIRGNSLLRSLPEVDPDRIGITGVSWGGVITCIAGSIDHRFAFAAPVYGCGGYYDDSSMVRKLKDGPVWPKLKRWAEIFDPCNYLAEAKCPFLWVDGSNDFAFPLPALQRSVDLPKTPHYRATRVRMPHAHEAFAEHPKELVDFAAFALGHGARKSYPRVTASRLDAGTVSAVCDAGEDKVAKAELNYTADLGYWENREWKSVPMTLAANGAKAAANLPKDAVAWYVNFFTADGKCVSGEFFRESDDAAAIQSRIDAAWKRGGGEVVVEVGEHRVRPLRLRSNVTLRLKAGAKLLASRNCGDYLATLAEDPLEPVSDATLKEVRGEDLTRRSQYALFRAFGAKNVRVVGEPGSVVDGGNCYDAKGAEGYRGPHTFWATCSTNVTFEGVTVVDSACYAFKTFRCRGVKVENVEIRGGHDGVHFDCCDDVLIAGSRILTGDDSVAGSGCTDILVTNCVLSSACSPFRLGGRNVLVTDCRVYGPAPCPHRWTLTAEEKARGLGPSEVGGRRNTGAFYQGYTGDKAHEGFRPGNIVVRNVTVDTVERFMVSLSGIPGAVWQDGAGIADITFENVKATGLGAPSVVVAKADRPLRLTLRNCSFSFAKPVGSAFLGNNIQVVDEGVTLKNAERLSQLRPDIGYDDIPEFPSWRIESNTQRAKWGLPPLKHH